MGVIEAEATTVAVKGASFWATPFGRINAIITGVFLVFLLIAGIYHSIDQHSLYPIFEGTILKITSADHELSNDIDNLESVARPEVPSSFFTKQMPVYVWFWLKWWWTVLVSLWFVWVLFWLLYNLFKMLDQTSLLKNVLLALLVFALLQIFTGMMMYTMNMAGKTLPTDKGKVFNDQMSHSIPMEGTFKLFKHIFNKELFYKVESFAGSDLGQAITNIPTNTSINAT